ncbi:reverse transcriptase domain-containing protein [Sphingosinicella sp.]|uniref:reverse transcriptase domain-containing protein n=1 Tax=Sphingosinicella sp. TaxID=1917971 RepID=UPI00182CA58E|nr:reverse transcriptase domain-containing protein [Sphingosinicella sp.]MBA4758699.1 hypothetical protein [Sphingosinicella sp.]
MVFERALDRQLRELRFRVTSGFKPHGLLAFAKPKENGSGNRIICVPTIADRLLQFSILNQLRPRLLAMGMDNPVAFGLAPGSERSVLGARKFACKARNEYPWVYKADIHKFFDNLERTKLSDAVSNTVRQPSLVPILHSFLATEIEDGTERGWRSIVSEAGIRRGLGVRQGMPLSPFYAGVYLRNLDRQLARRGVPVARYVDDIVAFFSSEAEAHAFHTFLKSALGHLGLSIGEPGSSDSKTVIYNPDTPATFLGMELSRRGHGPYQLRVAPSNIATISSRIGSWNSIAALLEKRVTLTTMGGYFKSVIEGYLNAYSAAQNRDDLRKAIERASVAAQASILRDLLGVDRLQRLSSMDLQFLGVDAEVLLADKSRNTTRRPS